VLVLNLITESFMAFSQLLASSPGRRSGIAVWRQIAETLTTEIRDRVYADTGRLPGEVELSARFAVNRHTLRQAVAALQNEGLVRIEPGKGTFVQHELLDYALSRRTRFSENFLRQGLLPSKQLLTARELVAPERVVRGLRLEAGTRVLMVQTLDEANEKQIGLATAYYPSVRFSGLLEMLKEGIGTTDILRFFGVEDYVRVQSLVTTQMPSDETAHLLKQSSTRPVLCVECVDEDMSGVPIKYGETIFCGDRVQLVVNTGAGL
jgi:GntR family phosphonate transport system transcriptional regulator